MFTGLVQDLGTVAAVDRNDGGVVVRVSTPLAAELTEGGSIAVSGVCLTATAIEGSEFAAEVMNESLDRTSLGALEAGSRVNLELPLGASDRLDGHVVLGHCDGRGTVTVVTKDGFASRVTIEASPELLRYVVSKGSIAVDGVSLTVAGHDDRSFTVSLIPETLDRTSLGSASPGTIVNLEVDVLAKYVERLVAKGS